MFEFSLLCLFVVVVCRMVFLIVFELVFEYGVVLEFPFW